MNSRERMLAATGLRHDIGESIPFENFFALARTVCSAIISKDGTVKEGRHT